MKKVYFEISNRNDVLVNKKFKQLGLAWPLIGSQVVDIILNAEVLDSTGLISHKLSRSYFKSAIALIEGPMEQTLTEFIKFKLADTQKEKEKLTHMVLKGLKKIEIKNQSKLFNRGYILEDKQLNFIINDLWTFSKTIAADDLNVDIKKIKVKKPNMQALRRMSYEIVKSKT